MATDADPREDELALPDNIDAKARELESELFGGADELLQRLDGDAAEQSDDGALFAIDSYARAPTRGEDDGAAAGDASVVVAPAQGGRRGVQQKRKPAWVDHDDGRMAVDIAAAARLRKLRKADGERVISGAELEERLRGQQRKLHVNTGWAKRTRPPPEQLDPDEIDETTLESERLATDGANLMDSRGPLPATRIELTRVRDANMHDRSHGAVQALEFHPNGQLLMAAALDRRLRFFAADGVANAPVQSLLLDDMPIHTAHFASGGTRVIASGRRRGFYVVDLAAQRVERVPQLQGCPERSLERFVVPSAAAGGAGQRECIAFLGDEGRVPLVSVASRQVVGTLRMSGAARAAAFADDGVQLYTSGSDGAVCLWDLRTRRCVERFVDEGCVRGTALAASAAHLATGSQSGVVNVYDRARVGGGAAARVPQRAAAARPVRALTNLVTATDTLAFSPGGEILCMASRLKKEALRLVHVPTLTTYANWPTSRSPLQFVHSACFSPGGGLLAIGNAKGHVLMYRLHHFAAA